MHINPTDLWNAPHTLLDLLDATAARVFRTELSQPGFAIADLGADLTPLQFRSMLIGFAAALDHAYDRHFSRRLLLRSMGRFDQKVSAEAHLDGAPDESILMLGYEPSEITSTAKVPATFEVPGKCPFSSPCPVAVRGPDLS